MRRTACFLATVVLAATTTAALARPPHGGSGHAGHSAAPHAAAVHSGAVHSGAVHAGTIHAGSGRVDGRRFEGRGFRDGRGYYGGYDGGFLGGLLDSYWGYDYPYDYPYYAGPSYYPPDYYYPSDATPFVQAPAAPIQLRVTLPDPQAQVWVDGQPTTSTGTERSFVTAPLATGHTYSYTVRATWKQDGHDMNVEKTVQVTPGVSSWVDFTAAPMPTIIEK